MRMSGSSDVLISTLPFPLLVLSSRIIEIDLLLVEDVVLVLYVLVPQ